MRKVAIMTILLLAALVITILWLMLHRTSLAFEKIAAFETEWVYRLQDGEPYDPRSWIWYTIPSNYGTGEIKPYLDRYGIVLNLEKYTYIVTRGYLLDDISISYWNSEKNENGSRLYYGHVVVSTDCPPNIINIYRTDRIMIVQNDVDREQLHGVTIRNDRCMETQQE